MKKNLSLQLSFLILSSLACVVALVVMGYLLVRTEKAEVFVVGARLSKALIPGSKGTEINFRLAMRLVELKEFPQAKKIFEELLVSEPQNVSVLNNLGYVLGELGSYPSASEYLQTAIQVAPECSECFNNLGTLLQRQAKNKEALEQYHKAASLDPNHPDPRLNLAVLYEEQGDWVAALDWYKQAESRVQDPKARKWVTLRALWMSELTQNGTRARKLAGEK